MTIKKKVKVACPRCGNHYKVPSYIVINDSSVCPSCFRKEREQRKQVKKDRSAAMKRRRSHKTGTHP